MGIKCNINHLLYEKYRLHTVILSDMYLEFIFFWDNKIMDQHPDGHPP